MSQSKVMLCPENLKVEPGSHIVLLYKDESELREFLPNYYYEGIKNNDVGYFVSGDDTLGFEVKQEITGKEGINKHQIDKNLQFAYYKDFYYSNGRFDINAIFEKIDTMFIKNSSVGIRTAGNMTWVNKENFDDFCEYETGLSRRYNDKNAILLCAYGLKSMDVEQLIRIMQAHTMILFKENGAWKISDTVDRAIYEQKIQDLEKFTKFSVGREIKMVELKKRIGELEKELKKYKESS